jgi:hypothetical protein
MRNYYLRKGDTNIGPLTIEQVANQSINGSTPVWFDGLTEWTTAGNVEELKPLLVVSTPPPFAQVVSTNSRPQNRDIPYPPAKKSTSAYTYLLYSVLAVAIFGFGYSILQKNGGRIDTGNYQTKVMSVEEIEKSQPARFLNASGKYNPTFWGDKFKVHGTITNKATVANFKDPVVEVTFYSSTETVLATERYTIYDYFPAHATKNFELAVPKYKNVKQLGWNVVSAVSY